uniref:Nedd4 family interacting protein 1 n=2 Tax=Ficedula albicollis TaxID=59894 RepID=A0A803V6X2_FICAL
MAMCFHERCQPTGSSLGGEQLTTAAFPRRAGQRGLWLYGTQLSLCAIGTVSVPQPHGCRGHGQESQHRRVQGHRTEVLGSRGLSPLGWRGLMATLKSGPFPSCSCLSPFSGMLRAQRTPAERTPDLRTHLGVPTSPQLWHKCSSRCAKPQLCRSTGTATVQRILMGSLGVTLETRPALGNLGKANPGGTARVGMDGRRHHGLPSALQNEEEPGEAVPVVSDAPPPYSSISAESTAYFDYKDESGFPKPPSYNVATTLPSYDEAERTKAEATIPLVPGRDEDFVTRDDFDDTDQLRIGNDGIFMLTFFMAFLFNWIGFFLSFCLTTSAAGRYGAISGFGLSLIKWILIVRFSTYFPGYFDGQYWLWWVFLVLGFLLFLRGFINYAKVRKMPDTFSTLPRTRVLFIY